MIGCFRFLFDSSIEGSGRVFSISASGGTNSRMTTSSINEISKKIAKTEWGLEAGNFELINKILMSYIIFVDTLTQIRR